jgi:succinoglycan biosynthesis protein ExoM
MLAHLLDTLKTQEARGLFSTSIVVVDNDADRSAEEVVLQAARDGSVPLRYEVEPEQNISLARNRALRAAEGDFLAGIDDDEFAGPHWLFELYRAVQEYGCDGVLGPVVPSFEVPPPGWVTKGAIFERKSFPSGTPLLNPRDMRCGNFLLARRIVDENEALFDPKFGMTGGEDVDFFARMLGRGYRFVWVSEVSVSETVPAERLKRSYPLKRALLRGVVSARQAPLFSPNTAKSLTAVLLYTAALPILFVFRNRLFMRILIKDCDHIGKVLARCGIRVVQHRPGVPAARSSQPPVEIPADAKGS